MRGKKVLITGSTSGIGEAAARSLAKLGADLILVARDKEKVTNLINELKAEHKENKFDFLLADLTKQHDIHKIAEEYRERYDRLDVLINNAGGIFHKRELTKDGYEKTFALNHLAYFLLTELFLDLIKLSAPSRIINVTSAAHFSARMNFEDLMSEKNYFPRDAYAQSKLANILFTYKLAEMLENKGVTVNCVHPGIVRTNFGKDNDGHLSNAQKYPFASNPSKGAETIVYLAHSSDVQAITGKYFENKKMIKSSEESYNKYVADKLWKISASLIKYKIPC
jgi:NAD(P)-dependent dehydrogenase (short-subunit alcohol dehydrogenase family)